MTRKRVPGIELETPTEIMLESPVHGVPVQPAPAPAPQAGIPSPPIVPAPLPRAATVQMISMKTPAELAAEKAVRSIVPVQVQIRPISDHARYPTPPGGLGFLAPPRDVAAARRRTPTWLRVLGMIFAVLALATAIATGIWFAALRA